jgi:preprotein translocase subunit SecY
VQFYFGGTSLLIVVGVAMDTVNQIEAQLIMRHYEGFTPRAGRIRGTPQLGSMAEGIPRAPF